LCLVLPESSLATDDALMATLGGLIDVSPVGVPRLDELLVAVPVVRERVEALAFAALNRQAAGDDDALAEFLLRWPSAMFLPEVARRQSLEVANFRTKLFDTLARRLRKSAKTMPRGESQNLARMVHSENTLAKVLGQEEPPLKASIPAVAGDGAWRARERQLRRVLASVEEHPRIDAFQAVIETCDEHAGRPGLWPGPPPALGPATNATRVGAIVVAAHVARNQPGADGRVPRRVEVDDVPALLEAHALREHSVFTRMSKGSSSRPGERPRSQPAIPRRPRQARSRHPPGTAR